MYQPKAIQILSSFNKSDWRACDAFLQIRLKLGHDCLILFGALRKRNNRLESVDQVLQEVKVDLFSNITEKSFTNLFSKLALNLEDYLVSQIALQSKLDFHLLLLKAYAERGLYDQFDKKARKVEKAILDEKKIDLFDQYSLLKINHLRYFADNTVKHQNGQALLTKLNNFKDGFEQDYDRLLQIATLHLDEVSKPSGSIEKPSAEPFFLSTILTLLLQFKKDSTEQLFQQLFDILMDKGSSLSYELSTIILEILIHRAHKQIREGQLQMIEALLDLYELGFASGMLLSNNRITENVFVNVVGTACAGEKYDRAKKIIHDYAHLLSEETKVGTIRISEAHIHYYREEYDQLVEAIRDFPFNSQWQQTRRRWMLICAYYKMHEKDWDFMYGKVKNYNNYFYNNKSKMSKASFEGSLNLSKFVMKMLRGRSHEELTDFTNSSTHFIYRKWALKEIRTIAALIS